MAELEKKSDDLRYFLEYQVKNPGLVTSTANDLTIEKKLTQLEKSLEYGCGIRPDGYAVQRIRTYMKKADATLVIHAEANKHVVVSTELSDKNNKKGPKIPDLCAIKKVQHAKPNEFIDKLLDSRSLQVQ